MFKETKHKIQPLDGLSIIMSQLV